VNRGVKMYKKLELLSKSKHKNLELDELKDLDFAKNIHLVTLGLSEVSKLSSILPIIITGGEVQQFAVFTALSNQENYFTTNSCKDIYIPMSLRSYPFTMVDTYEEGKPDKKLRAVALDIENKYIGSKKTHKIFTKDGILGNFTKNKVQTAQNFEQDKFNAQRLISVLKENELLDKRSFEIKMQDGKVKVLLSDFYVVNKEKLFTLEDALLLKWARNGWLFTIESHINSIEQISTLLKQYLIQK
jgi:hypothetical protein